MITILSTAVFGPIYKSDEKAIKLFAEAGLDGYCLNVNGAVRKDSKFPHAPLVDADDFREKAVMLRERAEAMGMHCYTVHAPCTNGSEDPEVQEHMFEQLVRCLELASIMGAEAIVLHVMQHLPYAQYKEEMWKRSLALVKRLVPFAEQYRVKIAVENLADWKEVFVQMAPALCSDPDEFCAFLDAVDSEWVVACLDFGHAAVTGTDVPTAVRKLGKKRLFMLHAHDNFKMVDQHMMPYTGGINMKETVEALKEIGFDGIVDVEVNPSTFPVELFPSVARMSADIGHYWASYISEK